MYRKLTFLFIALVMVSLMTAPVGKANAQVETQTSAPDCPPFDPAPSQDQNFLKSLRPECVKARRTLTQDAGTQEVLPIAGGTGSKYKSELSGLATTYKLYLPLVTKPRDGISGVVTYQGNPISGVLITLYRNNGGSSWTTIGSTYTQADGGYQFTSAPSLVSGQYYETDYYNTSNTSYVQLCYKGLYPYTAGSVAAGGNFDIADIPQISPAKGGSVGFPATFTWIRRAGVSTDNYTFDFWDNNNGYWEYTNLGYVSGYTLNSLPSGANLNTTYYWEAKVKNSDGTICWPFDQNRAFTFK